MTIEIAISANVTPSSFDSQCLLWIAGPVIIGEVYRFATSTKHCSAIASIGYNELVAPDQGCQSCSARSLSKIGAYWAMAS